MLVIMIMIVLVIVAFVRVVVAVRGLRRFGLGIVFEDIGARTQRFTFQAQMGRAEQTSIPGCTQGATAPSGRGIPHHMVRGFAGRVKPRCQWFSRGGPGKERHQSVRLGIAPECGFTFASSKQAAFHPWKVRLATNPRDPREDTAEFALLFGSFGLTDVTQKAGMGSAAMSKVLAGFMQAQVAVHGLANLIGVFVFLAVVFPPANGAQRHGARRLKRLEPTTRAAKANPHNYLHSSHWRPLKDGRESARAGLRGTAAFSFWLLALGFYFPPLAKAADPCCPAKSTEDLKQIVENERLKAALQNLNTSPVLTR
jgi:hypothetical protein